MSDAGRTTSSLDRPSPERARMRIGAWLIGFALLAAVIYAAAHFAEERDFVRVLERSKPTWLLAAIGLQAATYLAQGQIWRDIAAVHGRGIPVREAFELSLAKLFVDQALPSGGVSGTILMGSALERRGLSRKTVVSGAILSTAAFYLSYVAGLIAAGAILARSSELPVALRLSCVFFLLSSTALAAAMLTLPGRTLPRALRSLSSSKTGRTLVELLEGAEPRLVRDRRMLLRFTGLQVLTAALDAATVLVLVHACGGGAGIGAVLVAFMLASSVRTVGIVPGGLGTFEATLVWTLASFGTPLAVGLSASLLFRGLSFWLPMLPGLWFSRRETRAHDALEPVDLLDRYWALEVQDLLGRLASSKLGLASDEAARRRLLYGPNALRESERLTRMAVLMSQFRSPLLLLLLFAASTSSLIGEWVDATIVMVIVLASTGIGYAREYSARAAAQALRNRVRTLAAVVRDGKTQSLPLEEIVPGDVILLSAGSIVPADAVIVDASDCFVSEAALTGESFPMEKRPGPLPPETPLAERANSVFLGSNVRSGTARCLVVKTGRKTQFGSIAHHLALRRPETGFDRGLRRFGYLLTTAMLWIVLAVFAIHMLRGRQPAETLLFSVALAVGLSPELLPFILSLNLARGAQMMAKQGVLVRRLNAIENLGAMNVLCTDKTGTLTEGVVRVEGAYGPSGEASNDVRRWAEINASLQTGLSNPLDAAILQDAGPEPGGCEKLGEIPFDFARKRLSVVVRDSGGVRIITKGAYPQVIAACSRVLNGSDLNHEVQAGLDGLFQGWSAQGIRVIGVAVRRIEQKQFYTRDDERDMSFAGFVTFLDKPKEGVEQAIADLAELGVSVKLITGDHRLVAEHVAVLVGMRADRILTGSDIDNLKDEALWREADRADLFVEVDPNQKEKIILALQKLGNVVGFLGDGVNDAPAMHAADTSLSVEQAVDVAREAADFVLLDRHLDVIRLGIVEGRNTFANTLKYILTTMSANLGNMMSMAAASLFLPFLPLLAGQILLNNFLSDIPAFGLASDSVDREAVNRPGTWNIRFVGRFMVAFGLLSSAFDLLTFGVLLTVFHTSVSVFRAGWFVESLLTELAIAFVVRTRRPIFRSRPGALLLWSSVLLALVAVLIPFLPFLTALGFSPLPPAVLASLLTITLLYVLAAEIGKRKILAWCEKPPAFHRPAWRRGRRE